MVNKNKSNVLAISCGDDAGTPVIKVRAPYGMREALKSLPMAKWDPHHKHRTYPADTGAFRNILELAKERGYSVEVEPTAWDCLKQWDEADERRRALLAGEHGKLDLIDDCCKRYYQRKLAQGGKSGWARAVVKDREDREAIRKLLRELGCKEGQKE